MAFYKYLYVVVTLLMQRRVCHALMLSDASYQQQSFKLGVRVMHMPQSSAPGSYTRQHITPAVPTTFAIFL